MKKSPLRRRSKKREKEERLYSKLRQQFLTDNPRCAVFPEQRATQCHHSRGRTGRLLCEVRWWIPVSMEGHRWIEENHRKAREMFWSGIALMCAVAQQNVYPE